MNTIKTTLSSLEVAEMLGTEHWQLMRKLDGRKDKKGYIQILTDNQMVASDYFLEDTYKDASGKENKCYQFSKLGCDFIANKFTGEKGVLFTAKYVKRFYEMEKMLLQAPDFRFLNGFANLLNTLSRTMKAQKHTPEKIAAQVELLCHTYQVPLNDGFVKPTYEQMTLQNDGTLLLLSNVQAQ